MVDPQPINSESADPAGTAIAAAASHPPRLASLSEEAAPLPKNGHDIAPAGPSIQQFLRPIIQGIEALARAQFDQADLMTRVEKVLHIQETLPRILIDTKNALDQRGALNRSMFEALHTELKTYKDGFLMESVLKPVVRDLISLYDDITEIHRQLVLALGTQEKRGDLSGGTLMLFENVLGPTSQLEHNCHLIIEMLERLEVTPMPPNSGKLDKRNQRAVNIEVAEDPDQDNQIVKIVKRGFIWRERIFRPEEVIIKKWKEGYLAAVGNAPEKP